MSIEMEYTSPALQRSAMSIKTDSLRYYSETKNKETFSSPSRRDFLTLPGHSVQLILNFTIVFIP